MEAELAAIVPLVESAELSTDARQSVLWCLGQLPRAVENFHQTYESRYADEIRRLEQGLMRPLDEADATAGVEVRERLCGLHERLGLPALAGAKHSKRPPAAKRRKKSA